MVGKCLHLIKSEEIMHHIKDTVEIIGKDTLGFTKNEVGCHSIRSSFSMFLFLQNVRSTQIMLQGRWRSDAFITYIRSQVSSFSTGLSSAMMKSTSEFYTVPNASVVAKDFILPEHLTIQDPDDPRTRNPQAFAMNMNNGPGANNTRGSRPSYFHLWS